MIQGAIFDMDGVLVDNLNFHLEAWKTLAEELGQKWTETDIRRSFGRRNREILRTLMGRELTSGEEREYGERKEELYRHLTSPHLRSAVVPGLLEFLSGLKDAGLRAAVATSGPPENARFVLKGLDLEPFFDAVVTGAEVPRSKPEPDIFLLAAERLHLAPSDCVVFEDSSSGIEAARRAGCSCIALATTHRPEELQPLSPFRIVADFTHLSPQQLAAGL